MADCYTEDATYGWNFGPKEHFMAVGRDEIRDIALGLEMGGLDGWQYPYEEILIDEAKGQVVGFWRQIADATRADGSHYEVAGIGGSWFRYGGDLQWSWQRDWFDYGNAAALFMEMMTDGTLSDGHDGPHGAVAPAGPAPRALPVGRRAGRAVGRARRERPDPRLGFIGLGQIGAPMARRWLDWPGGLTVFDVVDDGDGAVRRGRGHGGGLARRGRRAWPIVISLMVRDDAPGRRGARRPGRHPDPAAAGHGGRSIHSTIEADTPARPG